MATPFLTYNDDLLPFLDDPELVPEAKGELMIRDVWARAVELAPCLTEEDFTKRDLAVAIIRGILLRWVDSGSGGLTSRGAGDYSEGFAEAQYAGGKWLPQEIQQLQSLCSEYRSGKAFAISMEPPGVGRVFHDPACSASEMWGPYATPRTCECGADLSSDGRPLWRLT